jgi:glycosyltransferase involved in cell wall biosynthesis
MTDTPVVSILTPILNEELNLPHFLNALATQDYPKPSLEILIADGGSIDRSIEVIREFESELRITVLDNSERKEAEWGKALAFGSASGSYIQCWDADMWPSSPTLISRLVEVLEARKDLDGAVARYQPSKELSLWSRYLSFDEFQRDPLFQVLTPSMDDFITEQCAGFDVCTFPSRRVPPMGQTTMYRREDIDLKRWGGSFNDIDLVAYLVEGGKRNFGYVRDVGWIHEHCSSFSQLLRKRRRNMLGQSNSYLRLGSKRDFVWLDTTSTREVVRLCLYTIQANLFIPETVRGIRDAIRFRSWEQLLRPIASVGIADTLAWDLIRSDQGRLVGRRLLRRQALHGDPLEEDQATPTSNIEGGRLPPTTRTTES